MEIYHFIKYNEDTNISTIIAKNISGSIICFDLEDSIRDPFNPDNDAALKNTFRQTLKKLINQNRISPNSLKIGLRLNSDSAEFEKDIEALRNLEVTSIFIPKTENPEQIINVIARLKFCQIIFKELIPVIESVVGLRKIEQLIHPNIPEIKHIAFGHCDYNLDANIFPFFHQQSREYWSWIENIISKTRDSKIGFVNSPFLKLNQLNAFEEMLASLSFLCGNHFGQITLTFQQSEICKNFRKAPLPLFNKLPLRLNMFISAEVAENFIFSFEKENKHLGFTITLFQRTFLAPQEYIAAKQFLNKNDRPSINFTFVGGCFPVQANIPFDCLFHQQIKYEWERKEGVKFNINIIRYERFKNCFEKIQKNENTFNSDFLIFCVRMEPVLRLTKFLYKYIDNNGKRKSSFNFPFFGLLAPEKYDLLETEHHTFNNSHARIKTNNLLYDLNLAVGILFGNKKKAFDEYLNLITRVKHMCEKQNIKFFLMGPSLRDNTKLEKYISLKLESYMKNAGITDNESFIIGSHTEFKGKKLFNGIYANENYHSIISENISRLLKKEGKF